jgi:hypothetical protein
MTLVEVTIATVITATLLLAANGLITAVAGEQARMDALASSQAEATNSYHILRQLLSHVETRIGPGSSDWVEGSQDRASLRGSTHNLEFSSRCERPEGWVEPCYVLVRIRSERTSFEENRPVWTLSVIERAGSELLLTQSNRRLRFLYLTTAVNGGLWSTHWNDEKELPMAVGLDRVTDTLIVPVRLER